MSSLFNSETRFPKTTDAASATGWIPGANGGRLRRGGKPGNKGGGRPSKDFSLKCAELREEGLELLRKIVMLEPIPGQKGLASPSQILRAAKLMAKYADGHEHED